MLCFRSWYLRGISTGDFQEALSALLDKDAPNLSPAVITRLTAEWQADYEAWQKRDLSARRYVYVWADGVYPQARMEAAAECMLVLIGATPEGKKELKSWYSANCCAPPSSPLPVRMQRVWRRCSRHTKPSRCGGHGTRRSSGCPARASPAHRR